MNPITFTPLYQERVWGGRELSTRLGRPLPGTQPVGEAWEVVDRPEAQSVVDEGPLRGRTLHELWSQQRTEIFGPRHDRSGERFPLLGKLLDARDRLSVQVHPPAALASQLGGEPKTEMWYFLACDPGSHIFAGLRRGTTREEFAEKLQEGTVDDCLHRLPTRAGDSIFIPSGRLHAIGGGNLLAEIQQNSDTTYRVFDWNRTGLDGRPRDLHIAESLRAIDFEDFAPPLQHTASGVLADCEHFRVEKRTLDGPMELVPADDFALATVVAGAATCGGRTFPVGAFFLLPAGGAPAVAPAQETCHLLITTLT